MEYLLKKIGALFDVIVIAVIFGFAIVIYWLINKLLFLTGK